MITNFCTQVNQGRNLPLFSIVVELGCLTLLQLHATNVNLCIAEEQKPNCRLISPKTETETFQGIILCMHRSDGPSPICFRILMPQTSKCTCCAWWWWIVSQDSAKSWMWSEKGRKPVGHQTCEKHKHAWWLVNSFVWTIRQPYQIIVWMWNSLKKVENLSECQSNDFKSLDVKSNDRIILIILCDHCTMIGMKFRWSQFVSKQCQAQCGPSEQSDIFDVFEMIIGMPVQQSYEVDHREAKIKFRSFFQSICQFWTVKLHCCMVQTCRCCSSFVLFVDLRAFTHLSHSSAKTDNFVVQWKINPTHLCWTSFFICFQFCLPSQCPSICRMKPSGCDIRDGDFAREQIFTTALTTIDEGGLHIKEWKKDNEQNQQRRWQQKDQPGQNANVLSAKNYFNNSFATKNNWQLHEENWWGCLRKAWTQKHNVLWLWRAHTSHPLHHCPVMLSVKRKGSQSHHPFKIWKVKHVVWINTGFDFFTNSHAIIIFGTPACDVECQADGHIHLLHHWNTLSSSDGHMCGSNVVALAQEGKLPMVVWSHSRPLRQREFEGQARLTNPACLPCKFSAKSLTVTVSHLMPSWCLVQLMCFSHDDLH